VKRAQNEYIMGEHVSPYVLSMKLLYSFLLDLALAVDAQSRLI
jgi:hypothetical protein